MKLNSLRRNDASGLSRGRVIQAVGVVAILMFAKFVYTASLSNYFTFYLIRRFGVTIQESQVYLFVFLAAGGYTNSRRSYLYLAWLWRCCPKRR